MEPGSIATYRPALRAYGGQPDVPGPARTWARRGDIGAQLILTTWPPFLHSCGLRPPAGAMLQFET